MNDHANEEAKRTAQKDSNFYNELRGLLNQHSQEGHSNTPDFLLAAFITTCVDAYHTATKARDKWYGVELSPGRGPRLLEGTDPLPVVTPLEFARRHHNYVHDIAARGDGPVGYTVWAWEEMSEEHRNLLCLAAERFLEEL